MNIAVADDQPIFVEGLMSVLAKTGHSLDCKIIGVARDSLQLQDLLAENITDLVLLDINLPEPDDLKIIPEMKKKYLNLRVLIMSAQDDPRLVKAAFRSGADGYLLKNGTADELFEAIEEVLSGNTFLGKGVAVTDDPNAAVSGSGKPDDRFMRKYGLTRREIEIMRFIGQAFSNKEIAGRLFISDQTVSVHRKNIMRKIGVKSTATLIKIAYENNLV